MDSALLSKNLDPFPMEPPATNITHLSEAMLTEILARLPLRSISRIKSVCKTWKSTLESAYFRRLFLSLHKNSSSSWSLKSYGAELIGFYGCETWDLPKSLASFSPPSFKRPYYAASSNGLVLIEGSDCYVGNPVLQQWVKIPSPPQDSFVFGLVTRVDDDGVVLSFKVVMLSELQVSSDCLSHTLFVSLYSSETGIWTSKQIHCPCQINNTSSVNLNGTMYLAFLSESEVFVSHDFYSESDQFRVIRYPDHPSEDTLEFKRALTTSAGFVMYMRTLAQKEHTVLKVWSLSNDNSWQVLWKIGLSITGDYVPMAMHPFDSSIVFLWCLQSLHVVSCNLEKQNYVVLINAYNDGHQDCFMDQSACKEYMDYIMEPHPDFNYAASIESFQFVLPRWMESMPRPPQGEMIDTNSLFSHITSIEEAKR